MKVGLTVRPGQNISQTQQRLLRRFAVMDLSLSRQRLVAAQVIECSAIKFVERVEGPVVEHEDLRTVGLLECHCHVSERAGASLVCLWVVGCDGATDHDVEPVLLTGHNLRSFLQSDQFTSMRHRACMKRPAVVAIEKRYACVVQPLRHHDGGGDDVEGPLLVELEAFIDKRDRFGRALVEGLKSGSYRFLR
jgi:hypothetical protein